MQNNPKSALSEQLRLFKKALKKAKTPEEKQRIQALIDRQKRQSLQPGDLKKRKVKTKKDPAIVEAVFKIAELKKRTPKNETEKVSIEGRITELRKIIRPSPLVEKPKALMVNQVNRNPPDRPLLPKAVIIGKRQRERQESTVIMYIRDTHQTKNLLSLSVKPPKCRRTLGNSPRSHWDQTQTEFWNSVLRMPANFTGWNVRHFTGQNEEGKETWTKRQTLPRKSVGRGIGFLSEDARQEINRKKELEKGKPVRNYTVWPDVCPYFTLSKCPTCKSGSYAEQLGCLKRDDPVFWGITPE